MYHQLNRLSGRLVAAKNLQAPLFPLAPNVVQKVEPAITYNTAHLSTVTEASATTGTRKLIPGTNIPYAPVSDTIRQRQALFQKENDVPVFLKGGPLDVVLYRLTIALCILGVFGVGHAIFSHAIPKKN